MLKYKIILVFIGLFFAITANASALKVWPSMVQIDSALGKAEERAVTIENPGKDVAVFEVYPDDFSDWISVNSVSFVLNPGENREVLVRVNFEEEGIYATTLSVVSKPLSGKEFKTNAGVKIPLEIRVGQKKSSVWLASVLDNFKKIFENQAYLIFATGIVIILILLIIKKKQAE